MKRVIAFAFCSFLSWTMISAQTQIEFKKDSGYFKHMDLSLTLGSTGIGGELSSPLGNMFRLRAGFSIMPRFSKNMGFTIQVGDSYDPSKFQRLKTYLKDLTGQEVSDQVTMVGRPTYSNFNLLFDIYPFKENKHWYFTAGLFYGKSDIADAINSINDAPSLVAVNMYNIFYDKIMNMSEDEPPYIEIGGKRIDLDPETFRELKSKLQGYGRMSIHIGDFNKDMYETVREPEPGIEQYEDLYGNVYQNIGGTEVLIKKFHKEGDPYLMTPDANSTVRATATVNKLKPYVGFGYEGRLFKNDDKFKVGFDCGAMFWGGAADVVTHEGINLTTDLRNIRGDVDNYIKAIKFFKVFPVINLRISRTIF